MSEGRDDGDPRRLERLVRSLRDRLPADDAGDEHERGWRRLQGARDGRARERRWGLAWLLVPAAAAAALAIWVKLPGRSAARELALEVRGGEVVADGVVAVDSPLGATLSFSDGTEVDVGSAARVRVVARDEAAPRLALDQGRLGLRAPARAGRTFTVDALAFSIATTGGEVDAELGDAGHHLEVTVREGAASVRSPLAADAAAIQAGQRLAIDLAERSVRVSEAPTGAGASASTRAQEEAEARAAALAAEGRADACPARYIDPAQQTALGAADGSHWLQPWRAWLETVPAARLLDAPGLTLADRVIDDRAARLIGEAGFRHATVEMAWDHLAEGDLSRFEQAFADDHREVLRRLKRAGVRTTMLLNAWGGPPARYDTVVIAKEATRGEREVWLDPASTEVIVPGRTKLGRGAPADTLFSELLPDGRARLSRPLTADLPAGPLRVQTYLYAPFRRPTLASGEPDPIFQETLAGWTRYVRTNLGFAAEALREANAATAAGDAGFDVEVWNLAASAKDLFDIERYYEPVPPDVGPGGPEAATNAMLAAVVNVARDPAGGFAGARIVSGFSNRRWSDSALTLPAGVDALGRHVVLRPVRFPQESGFDTKRPLDARGFPDGARGQGGEAWKGAFVPAYEAHFPERALTALGDEPLFRDVSPLRSLDAAGVAHQRASGLPEVWVNSLSLQISRRRAALGLSPADVAHQKAKFLLRAMAAYTGKGASRVVVYQHDAGEAIIDPVDPTGGEPVRALGRFLAAFRPAAAIANPRRVTLEALERCPPRIEFAGEGGAQHPGLRQGDVFAFLPFQVDDSRVVVAVYVMTRNAFQVWGGSGPRRFDMPPARFRLRLGGASDATEVTLVDPLATEKLPPDGVRVISRGPEGLVLDVAVTDSPRLLTLAAR